MAYNTEDPRRDPAVYDQQWQAGQLTYITPSVRSHESDGSDIRVLLASAQNEPFRLLQSGYSVDGLDPVQVTFASEPAQATPTSWLRIERSTRAVDVSDHVPESATGGSFARVFVLMEELAAHVGKVREAVLERVSGLVSLGDTTFATEVQDAVNLPDTQSASSLAADPNSRILSLVANNGTPYPVPLGLERAAVDARIKHEENAASGNDGRGTVTQAQVSSWIQANPEVQSGVHAADALATVEDLLVPGVAVTVPTRNRWVAVGAVTLPDAEEGRELHVTVAATSEPTAEVSIPVAELRAAPIAQAGQDGVSNIGVAFSNPPDNNAYHLAWTGAATNRLVFASDTADTYTITLRDAQFSVLGALRKTVQPGDRGQFLKSGAAAVDDPDWSPVDGDEVQLTAGGFTGNLARTVPADAIDDVQKLAAAVDGLTIPAGQEASEVASTTPLPPVGNRDTGTIVNVNGVLWKVAAGDDDPHVYHGTIADLTGDFIGDETFSWEDSPSAIRYSPRVEDIGTARPPGVLYIELIVPGHDGIYSQTSLTLVAGQPATRTAGERWQYTQTPGDPGYDSTPQAVYLGRPFALHVYSDAAHATPLRVVESTNRWVLVDAADAGFTVQHDGTDEGAPGSVHTLNIEGGQGVSRDGSTVNVQIATVWAGTAAQFGQQTRAAGDRTLYVVHP